MISSRLDGQGAGDADALPLAAAEGMRELVPCVGREPDNFQQLVDAAGDRPARPQLVDRQRPLPAPAPTVMRGLSEEYGSWKIIWICRDRAMR